MIAAAALVVAVAAAAPVDAPAVVRRLVLVAGENDGGPGRPRLKFAGDDARSLAQVMIELGGVAPEDTRILVDGDRASIEDALAGIDAKARAISAGGERVELVFYYSGHSDDEGLLIGGQKLPYPWLRDRVSAMTADVRVVIVDSCSSGALVRKKGGKHVPAFVIDETGKVEGQAFLTSSRDDEASQESDRVGGSFFTAALVTGLRGAADTSGDGRVTLNEAYQFAFNETLAHTETAAAGAQHPAWDIELAGTGDLVLTDLRAVSAALVLDGDLAGRVAVRDDAGHLVIELEKSAGAPLLLGIAPGAYVVRVTAGSVVRAAHVDLVEGARTALASSALALEDTVATVARGDAVAPVAALVAPPVASPSTTSLAPSASSGLNGSDNGLLTSLAFVIGAHQARLEGLDLTLGVNTVADDATGALIALLGNGTGGSTNGVVVSTVANAVLGDLHGVELTSGVNVVGGHMTGVAASAGANVVLGGYTGVALSSGGNVVIGPSTGLSAGVFNVDADLTGLQLAVINVGGTVHGAQIGVINIADVVDGAQIGVVNVAASSPVSVGVLSFVGDGLWRVGAQATDQAALGVATRFGARYLYAQIGLGVVWDAHGTAHLGALTFGPGVHVPFEAGGQDLAVDVELVGGNLRNLDQLVGDHGNIAIDGALRPMLTWSPLPWLRVGGGPALDVFVLDKETDAAVHPPLALRFGADAPVVTTLSPGFTAFVDVGFGR